MNIYKEDLVEALATEPLGFGTWVKVSMYEDSRLPISEYKCKVCAVGSTFRSFSSKTKLRVEDDIIHQIKGKPSPTAWDEALPENWITAISYVWESIDIKNRSISIKEARTIMIDWVEANVPEDIALWQV